jgi:predicted small lipoprotein YifL
MKMTMRQILLAMALTGLAACGYGGGPNGQPNVPDEINPVSVFRSENAAEGNAATIDRPTALFGEGTKGVLGSTNGAAGFGYIVGQPRDTEEVIAIATFFPDFTGVPGDGPTTGTVQYDGRFFLHHVTGIGPDASGTFSSGEAEFVNGALTLNINFDDGAFLGNGTATNDPSAVLALEGQVSAAGALNGSASFAGTTADLQGEVFGSTNPDIASAASGAFAGSTATEVLAGGFFAAAPD